MDVGDWITEPELHAPDRSGWCPRWRLRSFSARLRFARLSCLAGQIELLEEFRNKPSAANRCLRFLLDYTWRGDGTGESLLFLTSYATNRIRNALPIVPLHFVSSGSNA